MAVRKKFGIPARPKFQQQVREGSCPPNFKQFRGDGVRWQKVWEGARHVYGEVPGAQLHGPYARSIVSRKEFWITRKGSSLGRKSSGARARRNSKSSGTLSPISKQFGREHVRRTKSPGRARAVRKHIRNPLPAPNLKQFGRDVVCCRKVREPMWA